MKPIGENPFGIISERSLESLPKSDWKFIGRLDHNSRHPVIKLHPLSARPLTGRKQCDQTDTSQKSEPHKLRLVETTAGKRQQAGQIPWCNREQSRNKKPDDQHKVLAVLIRLDQALSPYSFSEARNSKRNAAKKTWRFAHKTRTAFQQSPTLSR